MADPNDPLRENEVGAYGELAERPNPENLVILSIPPIEDMLPLLKKQLRRELTPDEIEVQRRKASSIVVNRIAAEKIHAERTGRSVTIQTDALRSPPSVTSVYQAMPTDEGERKEAAVELFGQHLFFLRNQLVESLRRVIESSDFRKRLGSLHRKEYDAVAALPAADREAAFDLARKSIDLYLQEVLTLFTGIGDSMRFGSAHAINYRLVLQVKEVSSDEVVEEFDVNRECEKVFYEYYGRWLNRYGNHR